MSKLWSGSAREGSAYARLRRQSTFGYIVLAFLCWPGASRAIETRSSEPVKIGAVLPFSGGVELYGNQARMGIDLAVKEINARGGLLGRHLEVVYKDDKTDPAVASEVTRALIERDAVLAIIGPITSRNLDAIIPLAEELKTPVLYATNYEGGKCSRYFFSFSTVPNQELAQLIPYMSTTFGSTYFLLGADRTWPHKMFDAAEPIIRATGGVIVGKEFTNGTEKDFASLVARVASSKAKVLLFAIKGDGLNFIPQADELGLFANTTVAFLGLSEADLDIFAGKGENMFVVVPFVAAAHTSATEAFVARVRADHGADTTVSNYVMTHYNSVMALGAAIDKAGKVDKEQLINALEDLTMASPTGRLSMGKNHHAAMSMFLAKTKGGELLNVRDLGEIKPEPGCY